MQPLTLIFKIRYRAIQMHLWIQSDASYLNEIQDRSWNGGFLYLSDIPKLPLKPKDPPPKLNAPILVNSKIINIVMSSIQEPETGQGSRNSKYSVTLCNTLGEMGHIQGLAPIQFDNIVINSIITDKVVQHKSKSMDIRFYFICHWCQQK